MCLCLVFKVIDVFLCSRAKITKQMYITHAAAAYYEIIILEYWILFRVLVII